MKITVVTGQRKAKLEKYYDDANISGQRCFFPETIEGIHPLDLKDRITDKCDMYAAMDGDLVIFTYSEIVNDTIRLWALKNDRLDTVEYIAVLNSGEMNHYKLGKYGSLNCEDAEIFNSTTIILNDIMDLVLELIDKESENAA